MRFRFIWIGKTRDANYRSLQDGYMARLSHFVKCDVTELRDPVPGETKEIEGKRILAKLNPSSVACLMDVKGRQFSSHELSRQVEGWQNAGVKEVSFIIGGADGVSDEVAARADHTISLSFLTFTHEMARVVLLEQLYRAFTIIKGYPYQK